MEEILQYLITYPYITVIIAIIIFILTLVFVVKRIFSFALTVIFLAICLISAYVILYPGAATKFLQGYTEEGRNGASKDGSTSKSLDKSAKKVYDTVRDKVDEYTEKLY